ncbi:DNA topoisomerase IV, alpha subunit, partial [Wilcoxina mikolae CBS 423.85]
IHHLLSTNQTATKRDIFYQHVSLFRTQAVVDKVVEDLAATFSVPRSALGIVAAAKGMVKGGMRIVMAGGESVECSASATLIPPGIQVERIELRDEVEWVLLVEKEAIFQRLDVGKNGVAVTGKGYPDVATRELLVRLAAMGKRVFALVDLDPHGIEIVATVRFGSRAMAHEGVALCVEELKWIGVRYEDLVEVVENGREGLLGLTLRDRQKAMAMLERTWIEEVPEWKEALQRTLFCGVKAEIEIL